MLIALTHIEEMNNVDDKFASRFQADNCRPVGAGSTTTILARFSKIQTMARFSKILQLFWETFFNAKDSA